MKFTEDIHWAETTHEMNIFQLLAIGIKKICMRVDYELDGYMSAMNVRILSGTWNPWHGLITWKLEIMCYFG